MIHIGGEIREVRMFDHVDKSVNLRIEIVITDGRSVEAHVVHQFRHGEGSDRVLVAEGIARAVIPRGEH